MPKSNNLNLRMKKSLFIAALFFSPSLFSQTHDAALLAKLTAEYGTKISLHKSTGIPTFIRFAQETPMELAGNTLPEKAASFFETYREAFGMQDLAAQLSWKKTVVDAAGGTHLMYQQRYQGVPVFGGDFRLHFNAFDELIAVNGVLVPGISMGVLPKILPEQAAGIALEKVAADHPEATESWFVPNNSLFIFRKGLVQGFAGGNYLLYEVEASNGSHLREFVYVDAVKGGIVEQFPGTCEALSRKLYQGTTGTLIWQEGDPFPGSLNSWQQSELNAAEDTYYFFENVFGHTSYNDASAEMKTVHNDIGLACPNAQWNGSTTRFCDMTGSDDVVAHEWGHAYTQYTSNLIYAWQAGALNESYSDIWGETVDLLTPDGNDNVLRTTCANSQLRWQIGEDATAFGAPLRDMWDPTCDSDPGKVTDTQYQCSSSDNGGVHTNSGVPNHAYALLTDGGTYNSQSITGLGLTKAAHIFWQAQNAYLTNTSEFSVMADALESACADLTGVNLQGLTTSSTPAGPSGQIITLADCQEVADVIAAVEFRTGTNTSPEPNCSFQPMLAQSPPDPCSVGTTLTSIFSDSFESGLGNWTITQIPSNPGQWTSRQWQIDATPPDGRSGSVAYGPTPDVGDCDTDNENGIIRMQSPVILIPAGATAPVKMTFYHNVSMESGWDGGNLKYRLNGGAWTLLPSSAFTYNAYNYAALITAGNGNSDPLAGQSAFSESDGGSLSGTWGQSQINLANISVVPGSTVQFRFETGTDGCTGWEGWYIDDVAVFSCESALPVGLISFRATPAEGAVQLDWATASEFENAGFELQRSAAPAEGFEKIAFLEGKDIAAQGSKYQFTDRTVSAGQAWYYRLRQLDFDGTESYSPIATATLPAEARLLLQPNPAGDFVDIKMTGNEAAEMEILLLDLRGKALFSARAQGGLGLDLTGFPAGVYVVKVAAGARFFVEKLVKDVR